MNAKRHEGKHEGRRFDAIMTFPGLDNVALTMKQFKRMETIAPLLHSGDSQVIFHAAEEMHDHKQSFSDSSILLGVVIRSADALHFERQGDHYRAASSYLNAATIISESSTPTKRALDWALQLIDSGKVNMDKCASESDPLVVLLGTEISDTRAKIQQLKRSDLPKNRD